MSSFTLLCGHCGGEVTHSCTGIPEKGWGVYHLIDPSGRVLYVGMTGWPKARVRTHLREFGKRVARVAWFPQESRVAAYDAETEAIAELLPPMNLAKVPR